MEQDALRLVLDGHGLAYEMQALCFAFFPGRKVECVEWDAAGTPAPGEPAANAPAVDASALGTPAANASAGDFVWTRIRRHGEKVSALCCVSVGGKRACAGRRVDFAAAERELAAAGKAGMLFEKNPGEKKENPEKAPAPPKTANPAETAPHAPQPSGADLAAGTAGERALGRAFYAAASRCTGVRPPWGILTGIRPVKLARMWMGAGLTPKQTRELFGKDYYTSPAKAALCVETARAEGEIVGLSRPESASLYISIPFCPTRCLYCSFVSQDVERAKKLVPDYVRLLCEEIGETGRVAKELGLRMETVYMGGGTPTALSAEQISAVLGAVGRAFDLAHLREYTVEAGRPDTITREKLEAILEGGARRISINPQTFDDAVLRRVGRAHTAADVVRAFALARRAGVPCINMDLIAGLPGDTPEGFGHTLDAVLELSPEAVTVHTLAMKRSSRLVTQWGGLWDAAGSTVAPMLDLAAERLTAAGYRPYYLYRQRNTLGGLENVGFARPGFEGLYNVFIMDETHTVLAAGAGGVTKLRQPQGGGGPQGGTEPRGGRIERSFNFKYPYEYISRFGEILQRKKKVNEFYAEFPIGRGAGAGKD